MSHLKSVHTRTLHAHTYVQLHAQIHADIHSQGSKLPPVVLSRTDERSAGTRINYCIRAVPGRGRSGCTDRHSTGLWRIIHTVLYALYILYVLPTCKSSLQLQTVLASAQFFMSDKRFPGVIGNWKSTCRHVHKNTCPPITTHLRHQGWLVGVMAFPTFRALHTYQDMYIHTATKYLSG